MEISFITSLFSSLQYVESELQAMLFVLLLIAIVIFSIAKFHKRNINAQDIEKIEERIESIEKNIDQKIDGLEKNIDQKIEIIDMKLELKEDKNEKIN